MVFGKTTALSSTTGGYQSLPYVDASCDATLETPLSGLFSQETQPSSAPATSIASTVKPFIEAAMQTDTLQQQVTGAKTENIGLKILAGVAGITVLGLLIAGFILCPIITLTLLFVLIGLGVLCQGIDVRDVADAIKDNTEETPTPGHTPDPAEYTLSARGAADTPPPGYMFIEGTTILIPISNNS